MRRLLVSLFVALFLSSNISFAQLEVVFVGVPTATSGGQVSVDVTVNNWTDLIGCQFSMNWDPTVLQYNSASNFVSNPPIEFVDISAIGTPAAPGVDAGQATFSWFAIDGNTYSAPNGTRIFTIIFDAIGDPCTSTSISLSDDPLPSEAYLDDANNTDIGVVSSGFAVNVDCDMNMPCGPNNGNPSCGSGDTSGVGLIGSDELVPSGDNVCMEVTVDNFIDIQSGEFNMVWDASLLTYTGIQNICDGVDGLGASNFNPLNNGMGQDTLRMVWFDFSTMNPATLTDGKILLEVCFDAVGANGSYADVEFLDVEFGDSNQVTLANYTDCGSVEICQEVVTPDPITINVVSDEIPEDQDQCISVTTDNFIDVGSFQFNLQFDENNICFDEVASFNPLLLTSPLFNLDSNDPGVLILNWLPTTSTLVTIPNGEELFEICFTFKGDCMTNSGINDINIVGTVPGTDALAIEFTDGNVGIGPIETNDGTLTTECVNTPCNLMLNVTNPTCNGGTGSISVSGMAMPYQDCTWTFDNGSNPTGCNVFAGLPGTYNVTVTDANGQMCTATTMIVEPDDITFDISTKNIDCAGPGNIDISNIEGGSEMGFMVDPPLPLTVTTAGSTLITVTDSEGCSSTQNVMITNEVEDLAVSGDPVSGCDSKITITISGGCPPYSASDGGVVTGNEVCYSGLAPGNYDFTISDDTGLSINTPTYTLDEVGDPEIQDFITTGSCDNASGQIVVTVSGGCPPYSSGTGVVTGNMVTYSGLTPGTYTDVITDSEDNMVTTPSMDVPFLDSPTIEDPILVTNCTEGMDNGSATLNILGGTPDYVLSIDPNAGNIAVNGSEIIISDLGAGDYNVTVTDDNECSASGMFTIVCTVDGDPVDITEIVVTTEDIFNDFGVSCNGECDGMAVATVSGGSAVTSISWTDEDGVEVGDQFSVDNLCAGTYTLNVEDADGNTDSEQVVVTEPDLIEIDVSIDCETSVGSQDGSIDLAVTGGVGAYIYEWNTGDDTEDLVGISAGSYFVSLTDENNCVMMPLPQEIVVSLCPTPCQDDMGNELPCYTSYGNIITPGLADGVNDVLDICCAGDRDNVLNVFDRWGRLVHQSVNYNNDWNGVSQDGELLGEGTYYWIMDVTFDDGQIRSFKGYVTILRDL